MLSRSTSPRSHTSALASPFAGSPLLPGGALPVSRDAGGAHAAPAVGTAGERACPDLPRGCLQHAHHHWQGHVQALKKPQLQAGRQTPAAAALLRRASRAVRQTGRPRTERCRCAPPRRCRPGTGTRCLAAAAAAARSRRGCRWRAGPRRTAAAAAARWPRRRPRRGAPAMRSPSWARSCSRPAAPAGAAAPPICGGEAAELMGSKPNPADMEPYMGPLLL